MGNNQPKYLNSNEAIGIMGDKTWERLRKQLRSYGARQTRQPDGTLTYVMNQSMDYALFSKIIQVHYEYIPRILAESLFLGFATDLNTKVDIDEFISSLAVISGQNRSLILRFLFRIYDCRGNGYIERYHVEKILKLAYLYQGSGDIESARKSIANLFRTPGAGDIPVTVPSLTFKEFEQAAVPLRELGEWVQTVLRVFTDPLPPRLAAMDKRYSSNFVNADVMAKYQVTDSQCSHLRVIFQQKCSATSNGQPTLGKQELSLNGWITITKDFLPVNLASMIFLVSTTSFKTIWRLEDFVDFCFIFGHSPLEDQATHLCNACFKYFSRQKQAQESSTVGGLKAFFRRIILLLAQTTNTEVSQNGDLFSPSEPNTSDDSGIATSSTDLSYKLETLEELQKKVFLPSIIAEALDNLDRQSAEPPLRFYIDLLCEYNSYLPSMRELEITSCCLFGVQPSDPAKEKEFIMELMVKRHGQAPQNRAQPYGPVGTEWCLIVKSWWDSWRFYVGHKRAAVGSGGPNSPGNPLSTTNHSIAANTSSQNGATPPRHPGEIDNWALLKKSGSKQIIPGIVLHNDVEIIPPTIYHALQMWYGGGPRLLRKVISTSEGNVTTTELELFPLSFRICTCSADGHAREPDREVLMSRMQKVSNVTTELARGYNVDPSRARIWNYAQSFWKDQYVLNPELTLEEAKLLDGQVLLLEISLSDGTWPRSQLHTQLDEEERQSKNKQDDSVVTKQPLDTDIKAVVKLNDGNVGLDNLGNTCYLNSSLQALLHTDPLVDYFLSQSYVRDINSSSKFGYNGKLALSFGRLVEELYRSNKRSIPPRQFASDLASIHQQFGGNQQHDAQELLAFLLDGLSEDLNLVNDKPYTIQPDSDGRPDSELADIWWENHFKRDLSMIQALFTGQFKSTTTCNCGFSSARFEPFNILAVPIPEDHMRMFTVHVVFSDWSYALLLTIRVDKRSDLFSVVDVINRLDIPTLTKDETSNKQSQVQSESSSEPMSFVAVEIINSKIHAMYSMERKLEMIRDGDNIFLYQTNRMHRGLVRGVRSLQLPPVADPQFEYCRIGEDTGSVNKLHAEPVDKDPSEVGVRVAFIQRRIRLNPSSGVESFTLDVFGLPFVHVVDVKTTGKALYDLVFTSVRPYLKAKIADLTDHYAQVDNASPNEEESLDKNSMPHHDKRPATQTYEGVYCASNEDVFAGPISRTGFTLRLVVGGSTHGIGCARCHWLSRCQGCVIPDSDKLSITLRDGETLAIDWHIAVFEELLDISAASEVRRHKSVNKKLQQDNAIPLKRCLDKFTEEEPLEGMVCPKCHNEDHLRKNFALWRLPPVLVVQLKRFQFDNTSRRKLTNRVDFPLSDFDLSPYMPNNPAFNQNSNAQLLAEDPDAKHVGASIGTSYDLYSAVHHIGALSGGHYLTAVKSCSKPADGQESTPSWRLYNDDVTTEITDLKEICSPSAYLLFYVRKDIQKLSFQEIFQPYREKAPPRVLQPANETPDRNRSSSITSSKSAQTSRSGIMKFMSRTKSQSSARNDLESETSSVRGSDAGTEYLAKPSKLKFRRSDVEKGQKKDKSSKGDENNFCSQS